MSGGLVAAGLVGRGRVAHYVYYCTLFAFDCQVQKWASLRVLGSTRLGSSQAGFWETGDLERGRLGDGEREKLSDPARETQRLQH